LLGGVVLLVAAATTHRLTAWVTGPAGLRSTATRNQHGVSDSIIAMQARGGEEDYSVTDEMIEKFHAETMTGSGGLPSHTSVIGSLIIKHFVGDFVEGKGFTRATKYKGPPPGQPGKRDMEPGVQSLIEQMKLAKFVSKGGVGPFTDEADKVVDDGKGWVWLAADMTPGGLFLELFTSVPYGKRPLIVAKKGEIDEVFAKVDWNMMDKRFDSTMGGPHIKQR